MKFDPQAHHRRSIRVPGYDYSQPGAYFVTICTRQREDLFGEITDDEMRLNDYGKIVKTTWQDLINHIDGIELGEFVVMPNHTHAIIHIIGENVGAGSKPAQNHATDNERAGLGPAPTNDTTDVRADDVSAGSNPAPNQHTNNIRAGHGPYRVLREPASTKAPTPQKTLSEIVRQLKTFSARRINEMRGTPGLPIWQRNYYEHIIRNEDDLRMISDYITTNPQTWQRDDLRH